MEKRQLRRAQGKCFGTALIRQEIAIANPLDSGFRSDINTDVTGPANLGTRCDFMFRCSRRYWYPARYPGLAAVFSEALRSCVRGFLFILSAVSVGRCEAAEPPLNPTGVFTESKSVHLVTNARNSEYCPAQTILKVATLF